ncbi:MAG TPA: SH3 domain-containing protein [Clostridia bacterium]|nr:SH3 domain-containing protein [Clostridia bacterium]
MMRFKQTTLNQLLALVLMMLFLSGCASAVQPPADMTPDPEPTDVPIELQTIEPTALPEETPVPEATTGVEQTPMPEATEVPVVDYIIAKGSVHSSKLNVRSGPDTTYKVIDTLYREAKLLIFAVEGYWLKVESVDSGVIGYVYGKYVGLDGASFSGYGFGLTLDDAQLYEDATDQSEVLGVVPRSTGLTILYSDEVTGYYCVSLHDSLKEGFIAPLYMSIVCRVKPSDGSMEDKTGYISGNLVNMRTGPGTGYRVIDKLYKGTELVVLSVGIDWYKIQVKSTGISGYVYGKYVSLKNPGSTPTPEPPVLPDLGSRGFINANGVNIRSGPSADYDSLGTLNKSEPLSYEGAYGNWFKVSALYARLVGWVYADFIDFPDPTPTPELTPQPR